MTHVRFFDLHLDFVRLEPHLGSAQEVLVIDGPLKNLKLRSCWQRLARSVPHDTLNDCVALASHALVQDLTTVENGDALRTLEAYCRNQSDQLDFDPPASVEAFFEARKQTPILVRVKKELQVRMADNISLEDAIPQALDAMIEDQISKVGNRFKEALIYDRDTHKMSREACQEAFDKINATLNEIDRQGIRDALRAGNTNAFKDAASKKAGLEEGPLL